MIEANINPLRGALSESSSAIKEIDALLKGFQRTATFTTLTDGQKTTALEKIAALKTDSDTAFGAIQVVIDATEPIE